MDEKIILLLQKSEDLVSADALRAIGVNPDLMIAAATDLLHEAGTHRPMIHIGAEAGVRSCCGFRKPS